MMHGQMIDRRNESRLPVGVSFRGGGGSANLSGRIFDLSSTGLFLATQRTFPKGTQVHVEFDLRFGRVDAVGEVRWVGRKELPGLGVRFLRISAASLAAIESALSPAHRLVTNSRPSASLNA
jgi:hypothetical protein